MSDELSYSGGFKRKRLHRLALPSGIGGVLIDIRDISQVLVLNPPDVGLVSTITMLANGTVFITIACYMPFGSKGISPT